MFRPARYLMLMTLSLASCSTHIVFAENYAFVVGVNAYERRGFDPLSYAEQDSQAIAAELKKFGFQTTLLTGSSTGEDRATLANINRRLDSMLKEVKRTDIVLVVLAGHGQQLDVKDAGGQTFSDSFFCPVDAVVNDPTTQLSLSYLLDEQLAHRGGKNLILVDACRDEPRVPRGGRRSVTGNDSSKSRIQKRGIQGRTISLPEDTAVLFSCRAGQSSLEAEDLGHGLFSQCVIEGLRGKAARDGRVTWTSLVDYVTDRMSSPELQKFMDPGNPQEPIPVGGVGGRLMLGSLEIIEKFKNSLGIELVLIPAGEFEMGSNEEEWRRAYQSVKSSSGRDILEEWFSCEAPRHHIKISRPFYLGQTEVTRGQFRDFVEATGYRTESEKDGVGGWGVEMEADGSSSNKQSPKFSWRDCGFQQTDAHPVVNVSWNDALAFCEWLSRKEKRIYRLPTEAEWEYACRARSNNRFGFGDDEESLIRFGNVADGTHKAAGWSIDFGKHLQAKDGFEFSSPVGSFRVNSFGLYDMHGNVWEWCSDWYGEDYYGSSPSEDPPGPSSGSDRVSRGGGWDGSAEGARSAYRSGDSPGHRGSNSGFRLASNSSE